MWIGTQNGLFRYERDSNAFIVFLRQTERDQGLPDNYILGIYEDFEGLVWVITTHGVGYIDCDKDIFRRYDLLDKAVAATGDTEARFSHLTGDRSGNIFIHSSNGLWRIDRKKEKLQRLEHTRFLPYAEDINYLNTRQLVDRNDYITGFGRKGRYTWDHDADSIHFTPYPENISFNWVSDVIRDEQGNYWIGTHAKGLFYYQTEVEQITRYPFSTVKTLGIQNDQIEALYLDSRSGNLWIGTLNGLQKVNERAKKFPLYQIVPGEAVQANFIYRTHLDPKGGIWMSHL